MARPKGSKNKPKSVEQNPVVENHEVNENDEGNVITAKPAYMERAALLKEINDSNKERYQAEEQEEEQEEVEQSDEVEQEAAQQVEQEEPEAEKPKQKLVIDGVEKELTFEEIIALAQKAGAVDARLAEATRIREDAKRASAATLNTTSPAPQPPSVSSPSEDVAEGEVISQITQALMYGEEEKVSEAVKTILGRGRRGFEHMATQTQGMTPDQISGYVQATLAFEKGKQLLETPAENGGLADIKNDPMLYELFVKREAELRDVQKDNRPHPELYKAIGEEIRKWRDDLVKQYAPKTGFENREQLKQSTGIVRGGGSMKLKTPPETIPKTLEDKVAAMRRARGLN